MIIIPQVISLWKKKKDKKHISSYVNILRKNTVSLLHEILKMGYMKMPIPLLPPMSHCCIKFHNYKKMKMIGPLKIFLHAHKKKILMKSLLMLPLKIKIHLMIHLKSKYMRRISINTLMTRASKHPSIPLYMKTRV
jgi:hypothetical protein